MTDFHRRNFLCLSGAAAVGTLLGSSRLLGALPSPANLHRVPEEHLDVVIVGAGLSGLMAARTFVRQGVTNIRVLEGRGRVGGRTENGHLTLGAIIEDGGQWIGPTQTAILDLMNQLGISRFPTYTTGRRIDDTHTPFGPAAIADYLQARRRINKLSQRVPLDRPWTANRAAQYDSMTLQDWMDRNMVTKAAKQAIGLDVEASLAARPDQVSFLYFLFHVHSCTSMEHLSTKAQAWRITGGAQTVSLEMAAQLGGIVELDANVDHIAYDSSGALIQYNGRLISAKKVIVAMMPRDADRIRFYPGLPAKRSALQRFWSTGSGMKIHAVYPTPFWRAQGLNGQAISDSQFIAMSADNSPEDGSIGILVGFANDSHGLPSDEKVIKALSLASFAHFFGPQAWKAVDFHAHDWNKSSMSAGCVSPLRPGILTGLGPALRMPVESIHWAGTETSELWSGYMDGAVRAGERCAVEVRALLP